MSNTQKPALLRSACVAALLLLVQVAHNGYAALTDIANAPLFTSSDSSVHSNILFYLDDSGSMNDDFLPDDAPQSGSGAYGYRSYQCNGVAYNPSIVYKPPVDYTGASYPDAVFTAAYPNGFNRTGGTTNLTNAYYYAYNTYTGSPKALNYAYTAAAVLDKTSTFYTECTTPTSTTPSVFTQVTMTAASADAQNYANWYQYYRTRLLMMKTAVGLAFSDVDAKYRVGFNVINNKTTDSTLVSKSSKTSFLDPKEFDSAQKKLFYNNLYATVASPSTPLRGALSQAGQYYAHMAIGQTVDPVQYSCQKNYTILSTDGYWNTGTESTTAPKYGPYQLDNDTNVGQQDGNLARPWYDGSSTTSTTKTTWTTTNKTTSTVVTPVTNTWNSSYKSSVTTTYSGYTHNTYSLGTKASAITLGKSPIVSVAPCSTLVSGSCTITVTTNSNHGLSTGSLVTLANFVPNAYNGTFPITNTGTKTFTFTLGSIPAAVSTSGTLAAGSCPSGQGILTTQPQTGTNTGTDVTTFTTPWTRVDTSSVVTTTTTTTPYTETVIVVNGVTTSDVTVAGKVSTSSSTAAAVVTAGTASSGTTGTSVAVGTPGTITWTNSGAASTSCAASVPSPSPSATTPYTSTSASVPFGATTPTNSTVVKSNGTPGAAVVDTVSGYPSDSTHVAGTPVVVASGGSTDSLADVAMYYWKTDLRNSSLKNCTGANGVDVCTDNVPADKKSTNPRLSPDTATWQHMTTFTLGLGNSGVLQYTPSYQTQDSGDYYSLATGTKDWPTPTGNATNIDDLWHAGVNGHGLFFSASEPNGLILSLKTALDTIKATLGSASAAATSTLQPVQGDNAIYVAQFTSAKWFGDVVSQTIDPSTGAISTTPTWSAQTQLDAATPSARVIKYFNGSTLQDFTYANLKTDSLNGNFDKFCSKTGVGGSAKPIQCYAGTSTNIALANDGANLVDYLRGDKTYSNDAVFRARDHILGDIINASPLYVGQPGFQYTEHSYATFAATARSKVVYAAANDGMLHAFDKDTGNEKWAFIPSLVIPNIYKLADTNYPSNHTYFVDGSPVAGDIYVNGAWKTILVGGLGAGGRGYYALDITNPESPKFLWEFTNSNDGDLGLTYGKPIITKISNGSNNPDSWVVMFTSGYNNVSSGDGNGHLYVLNANTGAIAKDKNGNTLKLDTMVGGSPVGSSTTPSGLAQINNYVVSDVDNTTKFVYGGDLLGNVWRFDINSLLQAKPTANRLAQLKVGSTLQTITAKPSLAQVTYNGANYNVLYIGTGKYLGMSDLTNTDKQSIYAIKDNWNTTDWGDVRTATSPAMVVQTASLANTGTTITGTGQTVDWATKMGWYMDLIGSGERVTVNPQLVLNTLYVGTNTPNSDACNAGGVAWLYKLNIGNGAPISSAANSEVAVKIGNVLIVGMTNVQLQSKNVASVVTRSDGTVSTEIGAQPTTAGPPHKTSWRILH